MSKPPDIETLAGRLLAAMPRLDVTEQHIAVILYRELAMGQPVSAGRVAAVADVPEAQAADTLEHLSGVFRDDQQRIVGFMGLTIREMGEHRIRLGSRILSAWCAWDTLFLPELLGQTADVSSRSPASGAEIAMTVKSTGPVGLRPPSTVVSFLLPDGEFDADVIQSFCHFVHFFASPGDSEAWTAEHPRTFLLSVDDAYRLGQLTNRAIFGDVLAAAVGR